MRYRTGQTFKVVATGAVVIYEGPMDEAASAGLQKLSDGKCVMYSVEKADLEDRSKYLPERPYLPLATPPKFARHALVKEVATGITSIIVGLPADNRDSETFEPCYAVQSGDAVRWNVPQKTFEEPGRFVDVDRKVKDPSSY